MKTEARLLIIILLLILNLPNSSAQDNSQLGLPVGAIARLGKGGINVMRFSPDGTYLVVGTDVGLWIYDVSGETERALFNEYPSQVNVLSFSEDGELLASGGAKNSLIQLWELKSGNRISNLNLSHLIDESNSIRGISFFSDDKKLAILNRLGMLIHWDIETNLTEIVDRNIETNKTAIFYKKNNLIATEHSDGKIRFWDLKTGQPSISSMGHGGFLQNKTQNICKIAFSPNGSVLVSKEMLGTIHLWDTETRSKMTTLKGHTANITALVFSPDSKILASGDARYSIKLWDLETQSELIELRGHTSGICNLVYSPDGKFLASGSSDGTIRFWNPDTGKEASLFSSGHSEFIKTIAFSDNGNILRSADFSGKVENWRLDSRQLLSEFEFAPNGIMYAVAFSKDAKLYATQENRWNFAFDPLSSGYSARRNDMTLEPNENLIEIWDLSKHKKIHTFTKDKMDDVDSLLFSPDGNILVAGFAQQGIFSWDINTGDELFQYAIKEPTMRKLAFDPEGKLLATSGRSFKTQVWGFETGEELLLPELPPAHSIGFSTDGSLVAIGHFKEITLWYVTPNGLDEGETFEDVSVGGDLVFSPDNRTLVFSTPLNDQNNIKLLDVNTGTEINVLKGHTEAITRLVFSHDGRTLASASKDGTVLLWDWEKINNIFANHK